MNQGMLLVVLGRGRLQGILDVSARYSFSYNAFNNAYFAVRNLQPIENLTLEQLLEKTGSYQPPNIIVS